MDWRDENRMIELEALLVRAVELLRADEPIPADELEAFLASVDEAL